MLCLTRTQSAVPATKSALRGSPRAVPATKSAHGGSPSCDCHEICTSRFTKCCVCHGLCTSRFTKCYACHELCTSRFTKCCACHEIYMSRITTCCDCHEICTSRFTKCCTCHEICKRATCPKVTIHCTCHGIRAPHVQSAAPATKSALRSTAAPIPCTCHERSTLDHQSTRFPLRLPRKVTTMCENAHGNTTRAQSRQALAAATQISRACAVEMHFDDFQRHECTVNSSELAGHARALQRSKHQLLFYCRKNP